MIEYSATGLNLSMCFFCSSTDAIKINFYSQLFGQSFSCSEELTLMRKLGLFFF